MLPSVTPRGELKIVSAFLVMLGFMLLGFGGGLTLVEFGHRLFQHFGMRDQIILDDGLDVAALGIGETLRGVRAPERAPTMRARTERERSKRNEGIGKSF